jgi:hypothetical protein
LSSSFVLWMEKPMAPDDRDRVFDKALSRHLRSAGSLPAAENFSSGPAAASSLCLDAETLAAYHERSLLSEEMNSAKEHIAGCAHCQAILAQLELTDSIPLAAAEKEEALAPAVAPAAAKRGKAAPRPIRGPRWAWLVPAGALAAGLLVWIGQHEKQAQRSPAANEVKIASAEKPAEPLPTLNKQVLTSPALTAPKVAELDETSRARETASGATGGIAGAASKAIPAHQENLKLPAKTDSGTRIASSPALSAKESEFRKDKDAERDSSVALMTAQNQPASEVKGAAIGGVPQDQSALRNQAALNQNVNIVAQNQVLQQKVPGPSPLGQMSQAEVTKKAKSAAASRSSAAAAPAAAPLPPSSAAAFADEFRKDAGAIPNQHLVGVPGSAVRWLAGGAGLIEFSTNNGASWSVQSSGVTVDLLTGAATSDKVCWMVGRVGTIVLTTDGGEHWSVVPSPLAEDLGGIRASDALHATIWNLAKTKSFVTSDGGVTWKPVAVQ